MGAQVELHLKVTYTALPGTNHLFHTLEAAYRPKEKVLVPAMVFYIDTNGYTDMLVDMALIDLDGAIYTYHDRSIDDILEIHCFYAYM
ncbi:hypothetical protein [uncultured Microscilla sp.]|uniref:hypothetical protein n=1 Tax=uncultured Microscilla sp. TaxID=432653 RepID=UPI00261B1C58|nr:hypothetical protein [uncultured Microscilla sp.]